MKKLFLVLAVLMLLTSCTEEPIEKDEAPVIHMQSFSVSYYYEDSDDPIRPSISLDMLRKSYSFSYSGFSSFVPMGEFELTEDKLYLWTDEDKTEAYTFDVTDDGYVFDAKSSPAIPTYKVSGDSEERYSPVPDGALFKSPVNGSEKSTASFEGNVRKLGSDTAFSLSAEDAERVAEIIMDRDWQDGVTDCIFDCVIDVNGFRVKYHSSCGALNHVTSPYYSHALSTGYSAVLTDDEQKELNSILENYVTLGEDIIP